MYAKNAWEKYDDKQIQKIMDFNEGYKKFITNGKTERLCVKEVVTKEIINYYISGYVSGNYFFNCSSRNFKYITECCIYVTRSV